MLIARGKVIMMPSRYVYIIARGKVMPSRYVYNCEGQGDAIEICIYIRVKRTENNMKKREEKRYIYILVTLSTTTTTTATRAIWATHRFRLVYCIRHAVGKPVTFIFWIPKFGRARRNHAEKAQTHVTHVNS